MTKSRGKRGDHQNLSLPGVNSTDIARAARVSQSTVSRVINDLPGVRKTTRARVLVAMRKLGYSPNAGARALITGKTKLLGLVVSNITNAFYPEIVQAIGRAALNVSYNVILCNTEEHRRRQWDYLELLRQHRVDGLIMTSSFTSSRDAVQAIVQSGLPLVLVNRVVSGVTADTVTIDNAGASAQLAKHLLDLGHTHIAYIGGRVDSSTNRDRWTGFRRAMSNIDPTLNRQVATKGDFTRESGYELMRLLLRDARPRPTAVVCADDTIAFGCIDAISEASLRIPQDIAVVGFDDVSLASLHPISLTTVRQPAEAMGHTAVELLVSRIRREYSGAARHVVFPAETIHRRSCGCPLGAQAMPTYAKEPVVEELSVSH